MKVKVSWILYPSQGDCVEPMATDPLELVATDPPAASTPRLPYLSVSV